MDQETSPLACHCSAARRLARHATRLYERHLAPAGLTSSQFTILALLHRDAGMTAGELAEETVMDRTTVLRTLKPLQRDGLAGAAAKPGRARQVAFAITAAGERKLADAAPLWMAAQRAYEAELGPEHARRLRRELLDITRPG